MKKSSVIFMIFSKLVWFLAFLILLAIARVLADYIESSVYSSIVNLFFENLLLILIIFFFAMVSEMFWEFRFPFNIPAPLLSAGLSSYIITFIYRFFLLIKEMTNFDLDLPINLIYTIAAIGVIVVGYTIIITRAVKKTDEKEILEEGEVSWKEVGKQFKMFLYNLGKNMNKSVEKKRK